MKQKCFSWGCVLAACVFLFNPPVNLIDILPDFIGYALLLHATKNAAAVFPHFSEARVGFVRMLWISLLKLPALLLMLSVLRINSAERAMISVFTFATAIIELIFALSAFRAFFSALSHLGGREGLSPVLSAGRHKKGLDGVSSWTLVLLFTKGFCSFVPELSLISVFETLGSVESEAVNFARYYPIFLLFFQLVGYVLGAVWLYFSFSYFRDLKRSAIMREFAEEKALLHQADFAASAKRRTQRAFFLSLTAALILAFDITLDMTNYLPDCLSAAVFVVFFLLLRGEDRIWLYGAASSLLYSVLSLSTSVLQSRFLSEYTYTDVARRLEAKEAYLLVEVFGVLEALSLIGLCVLCFFALRGFIRKNVGATFDESNRSLALSLHKNLSRKALLFSVFGILSAVYSAAEKFLLTLVERHVITPDEANQYYSEGAVLYIPIFGGSWVLGLVVTAVWVCYGIYFISTLRSELYAEEEA